MNLEPGKVWYVGAGPGNPELITRRGHELLRQADVIIHDSAIAPEFFYECPATTRVIESPIRNFASPEELRLIVRQIVGEAQNGARVVRLKSGDPLLYSRALDEIAEIHAAGIPLEIVPGIAAPLAVSAYAGVPLTDTCGSTGVALVSGTDLLGKAQDLESLARLASSADMLCVMLVADQLRPVVERLLQLEGFENRPSLLVHKVSSPEQRVVQSPLNKLIGSVQSSPMPEPTLLLVGKLISWREKLNWFESLPLFGRRLLVCRPRHQSHETVRAIQRRGASTELLPLIEIEPITDNSSLTDCLSHLNDYDWVIFTSANGVEQFQQSATASGRDARIFGRAKVAVIGPGTAKPFEKWGIVPDLVAEEHVAEGLARQILATGPATTALLIRASEARDTLPNSLKAAGLVVNVVAAYRTRKLADQQREQLQEKLQSGIVDAVLLTSSSMAQALIEALGPDIDTALSNVCVASIGPITSATLARLGVTAHVTATTYTIEGLLDALESYFQS
jgi:uroporphyrinogen III methyltransferase/synthase